MKIVRASNFDDENYEEKFLEPLPPMTIKEDLQHICNVLNAVVGADIKDYYKVVRDDYILNPGFEP